jgi:hypothetical protein
MPEGIHPTSQLGSGWSRRASGFRSRADAAPRSFRNTYFVTGSSQNVRPSCAVMVSMPALVPRRTAGRADWRTMTGSMAAETPPGQGIRRTLAGSNRRAFWESLWESNARYGRIGGDGLDFRADPTSQKAIHDNSVNNLQQSPKPCAKVRILPGALVEEFFAPCPRRTAAGSPRPRRLIRRRRRHRPARAAAAECPRWR